MSMATIASPIFFSGYTIVTQPKVNKKKKKKNMKSGDRN